MRVTQARFPRHQLSRSVATSITASSAVVRAGDTCLRLWLSKTRTQFYFEDVRAVYPAVLARFSLRADLPSILRAREPRNWWERDLLLFPTCVFSTCRFRPPQLGQLARNRQPERTDQIARRNVSGTTSQGTGGRSRCQHYHRERTARGPLRPSM